jgi:hypothetical protein
MSSPARSLHTVIAAPATTLLVVQPNDRPDAPQKANSLPCCPSCDVAINPTHSRVKDSRGTSYAFLCCPTPVRVFHLEANGKIRAGRPGVVLLAFPHNPRCGIECSDFDGFPLPEDPGD